MSEDEAKPPVFAERVAIRYEQAVYGSFAFRPDGYGMLAHSAGCREEWLADFRAACQRIGERPAGFPDRTSLFAMKLASGPWCVVGIGPQGLDDKGRPGALAFHGLFLNGRDYRELGSSPFPLKEYLRGEWSESESLAQGVEWLVPEPSMSGPALDRIGRLSGATDRTQPVSRWPNWITGRIRPVAPESLEVNHPTPTNAALADRIANILCRGRKAALESAEPGDDLAREVWRRLPLKSRARLSVGTWAFGNGNAFDLFIGPRLAAATFDPSTIPIDPNGPGEAETKLLSPSSRPFSRTLAAALVAMAALLTVAAVFVALQLRGEPEEPIPSGAKLVSALAEIPSSKPFKTLPTKSEPDEALGPEDRERLAEALVHMIDRFGIRGTGSRHFDSETDPSVLMNHVADELRYRGPRLSDNDLQTLRTEPGHDAGLALRWDEHVRKFVNDRPLPDDFLAHGIQSQVTLLIWSFHSETAGRGFERETRLSPAERIQGLAESLAVDTPLRSTTLMEHYPPLASYLAFLGRLPRR